MKKINRNRGKKTSDDAIQQGDLFAHVYQNPDKKIEVDTTQGFEQWNQFISMVQDTSQQALLGRCKFIGIKNDRFCIAASDDDFAALKTSGLERLAQEFLTVSVHSCLYSIEAEQNKKAEEEVGEYRTSSF